MQKVLIYMPLLQIEREPLAISPHILGRMHECTMYRAPSQATHSRPATRSTGDYSKPEQASPSTRQVYLVGPERRRPLWAGVGLSGRSTKKKTRKQIVPKKKTRTIIFHFHQMLNLYDQHPSSPSTQLSVQRR